MKSFKAFLLTVLCATTVGIGGNAAPGDLSGQKIVGTWRLVAYEDHLADGTVEYPYGKNPVGLLIYDATGHMAIQIMKTPHPEVASGDEEKVTTEEKGPLFDSYVAYFGKYTVNWASKTVTHIVESDLYAVYVGTSQERPFELKGDSLTLTPHWDRDGKTVQGIRAFRRAR